MYKQLIFIFLSNIAFAQNILTNGDFEQLQNTDYHDVVVDWHICNVAYNCNNNNTNNFNDNMTSTGSQCDPLRYPYFSGKTKIFLDAVAFKGMENSGSGYLYQNITKKMKIGKLYKVEINYYFPKVFLADSALYCHLGFSFIREKPTGFEHFYNWLFTNDTIVFDQWFRKTWYVRPICDFNYFVMGISYTDSWPTVDVKDRYSSVYYLDKVSVTEIDDNDSLEQKNIGNPFCHNITPKPTSQYTFDSLSIYFNSNEAILSEQANFQLDTIANYLKKHKNIVLELNGFTDDLGNNHIDLAKQRVNAVIEYFQKKYAISSYRFIPNYKGNVTNSKGNERVRAENRKVVIVKSEIRIEQIFYQKALSSMSIDTSYQFLKKWLQVVPNYLKIFALFDTRLSTIKKENIRWNIFLNDIKSNYHNYKKPKDAYILDSMYMEDQKHRTIEYEIGELSNTSFRYPEISNEELNNRDKVNYSFITKYLDENGWPNQSEVGERPSRAAFYIIDHNLDTNSLKKYIPILEAKCREGEANWSDYATLFDRKEKECGRLQQY